MRQIVRFCNTLFIVAVILLAACGGSKNNHVRLLPLEGAYNVRDLGGYPAANGKTVKWNTVFRSGDLHLLTDADLRYLDSIGIKANVDFRDSAEIAAAPDRIPRSLQHQEILSIVPGNVIEFSKISEQDVPLLLVEGNKYFVRSSQPQYRRLFQLLMDKNSTPLLFHCSAGKDRVGFAAALFLSSLGVNRDTIMQDYLLTNSYLKGKYDSMIKSAPYLAPLLEARPEYLQAAFDVIDSEYGGVESYLTNELGVDLQKMRELYTE